MGRPSVQHHAGPSDLRSFPTRRSSDLVSGTKFEDPNADGTLTDGTVPAGPAAWTIRAYKDDGAEPRPGAGAQTELVCRPPVDASKATSTTAGAYELAFDPGDNVVLLVV